MESPRDRHERQVLSARSAYEAERSAEVVREAKAEERRAARSALVPDPETLPPGVEIRGEKFVRVEAAKGEWSVAVRAERPEPRPRARPHPRDAE